MAKIALELERALALRGVRGTPGSLATREMAHSDGWKVQDVVCTSGPQDRPFEERHMAWTIAIVVAGSFQYRGSAGCELMTPGSLVLGSPGQAFECAHHHGAGDRCISFWYAPDYFERLAADAGDRSAAPGFRLLRLPPLRETAALVARACAGLAGPVEVSWEELSIQLGGLVIRLAGGLTPRGSAALPASVSRVTGIVRKIERHSDGELDLRSLAREAGLSSYHFLRTFERLTGLTPHQYVLRARLREAAMRLSTDRARVIDVALDCGFGDVSNFNRAFRSEFGLSPRAYRRQNGGKLGPRFSVALDYLYPATHSAS